MQYSISGAKAMLNGRTPTVRVYVREKDGKRNFYPAPRNRTWPHAIGYGTRTMESNHGSALGITIWLRGRSSSWRDASQPKHRGSSFPRIILLQRPPILA